MLEILNEENNYGDHPGSMLTYDTLASSTSESIHQQQNNCSMYCKD